ncbi:RYR1 protein, partial [Bucorvus abyssinicus]|nr:RYR1 protein [Bucorvus abyssinicus]
PGTLQELISQTMVHWAQESFIQSPELVRAMFSLLHRQYDGLGELVRALPKAYTISALSVPDTTALLECLGQIRSLLIVQMGPEEENLMIQSIGWVPGAHPVLPGHPGSPSGTPCPLPAPRTSLPGTRASSLTPPQRLSALPGHPSPQSTPPSLSWGTLRTPRGDPTASPLRCPGALPRRVPPCEVGPSLQVVTYLASCGLQSCPMLLSKGYPDIGWNPCGGERYLDFLRFAVFVNGESVEENANVVVRLLIR